MDQCAPASVIVLVDLALPSVSVAVAFSALRQCLSAFFTAALGRTVAAMRPLPVHCALVRASSTPLSLSFFASALETASVSVPVEGVEQRALTSSLPFTNAATVATLLP